MWKGIFICIGMVLLSIFGSCVKWMNNPAVQATLLSLGADAVAAAFSGILMYCFYIWTGCNEGLAFIMAGLSGYYGTKGIDLLCQYIVRHFRLGDVLQAKGSQPGIIMPDNTSETKARSTRPAVIIPDAPQETDTLQESDYPEVTE